MTNLSLLAITFSTAGLIVAIYIYSRKSKNEQLVCLVGHDCDAVVHSQYGKTFGIENSLMGIIYNILLIALVVVVYYSNLKILGYLLSFWLMLYAVAGAMFSWYLMYVMFVKVKGKCSWCEASTLLVNLTALVLIYQYLLLGK